MKNQPMLLDIPQVRWNPVVCRKLKAFVAEMKKEQSKKSEKNP